MRASPNSKQTSEKYLIEYIVALIFMIIMNKSTHSKISMQKYFLFYPIKKLYFDQLNLRSVVTISCKVIQNKFLKETNRVLYNNKKKWMIFYIL